MNQTKSCKIEGCKRAYRAKGFCNIHFHKWRRGELKQKPRYKICGEENCKKALFKFGMCEAHYQAWVASRKGGAPADAPPPEKTPPKEPAPEAPAS
ncbi:MAG: hypothetical protein A3F82_01380 [Deltaproteobacteria bacterium RIFCSPLOWO2_12_FULL_44_12]|nr:MAG: hypothetical protein A2712_03580 [Deltaproteobacteria bacterium RIFCSPHIGHO2_01_FULL_43_49]OGQ16273.1 MAG: hypothetical protein A3D22_01550 [Deltaproteobacteria bacterium RIFCSPHIGHO2_02_FULL_44_53]OGQ29233.1 MAG: hypothetical protein A3D98_05335 [Deltaproteobacteria bacterium RIFCSPHIGHO2_12_FULL_44_21]OGQ32790.1 MAG: hypothetical protein A2979_09480 [Deltaproteobacteria bacterium RIFCSPLOWO2_01_FULL_45_74]OGQ41891.1 MAG: hypothetical protein A3I70_09265 [Deltaproteobacteria bacterium 